jgi:hypothetical protein
MKQKNFLKIAFVTLITLIASPCLKAQTLTAGDLAIIGVGVDSEEVLLVALADIPSGESVFFTDDEWAGSAFNSGEGFYEWVTPTITAGNTITLTKTTSSVGGTITQRAGSMALGNSGDGFFLYQTTTNVFNTGDYTILGFAGEDSGDAGTLDGTGLVIGEDAVYFAGDNGIYSDARTANSKSGHLANIYDNSKWTTSGTAQTFDTSSFTVGSATVGITLGAISGSTKEDGTTAIFTAVLDLQPATNVVLNISSGDTGEVTLDLATLTFTNADWDTPQTVTATGVDDALQDGSIVVTITVAVDDASSDDDYDAVVDVTTTVTNEDDELPNLVINEFQADPDATLGDANGDSSVDTSNDEFIEIYNASGAELNITNYTIEDGNGLKHTFPDGTILPAGAVIVVFGGGTPTGIPCLTQLASTGSLGLNNGGDSIIIKDTSSTVVTTYTYGSEGGDNQSVARDTDLTGAFVKHSTIAGNAVLFSPGRKNADNIPFSKTWTGTTDNDWATTTNWDSNSNPSTSTDNVWIPAGLTNYPTSAAAVTVNSVTINSGATLKAEDDFTGSVTYNRNLATTNWYLMSSPVAGETYDDAYVTANSIASGTGDNRGIALYTPSDDSWDYMQSGETATFAAGNGYSVKRSATGDISFTGTLNVADVGVTLSNAGNRFNLLGNPYTSHIASATFLTNEAVVSETQTLWVWNQATGASGAYEVKTISDAMVIAPAQGFFVKANAAGGTFNFAESNQASTGGTFQRTENRPEIYLTISNQTDAREAKIYYIENMTTGFDVGYEGELFNGVSNPLAIYTHLVADSEGKNYQVQSLPTNNYENMIVPVGVNATSGSAITINASTNNLPEGVNIYLEDKQDNSFTLLNADTNFNSTLENDLSGIGRFYLHTTSESLSTAALGIDSNISIYKSSSDNIRIVGVQNGTANVQMYNMLGKEVLKTSFEGNGVNDIKLINISTGVYILKIALENGTINKKIIIQ